VQVRWNFTSIRYIILPACYRDLLSRW